MKIATDEKLKHLISCYDPTGEAAMWSDLVALEESTANPDIIIPVLGTQGSGKSTLINAFVGEDILPAEVDETTCIPVEIRYGEDKAVVYRNDGTSETIALDKRSLSRYVDNAYNPGNEKGISRIIICRKYDALKNGAVIVDLPGVGSLTKANEETTRKYIEKLCAAIFVISTSPPILASEAGFIRSVWRGISTSVFVQNVWDDNSPAEVKEGLESNENALSLIAGECGLEYKKGIIPINVYAAARGRYVHDEQMVGQSNICELEKKIADFSLNYREIVTANFKKRVRSALEIIISEIEKRIHLGKLTREELLEELKSEKAKFQKTSDEVHEVISRLRLMIAKNKLDAKTFANELAKKKSGLLQAELFHLIESGVVDGEQLGSAFNRFQVQYGEEVSNEVFEKLESITEEFQKVWEELERIEEKEMAESPEIEGFYKEQQFKWEKGVSLGVQLASDVGGAILGKIVAGAIGGVWGGPIGVAVGIAVMIIGGFIGGKIKKEKLKDRANETKREIVPVVKEFERNVSESVIASIDNYLTKFSTLVESLENARQEYLDEMNARITEIRQNEKEMDVSMEKLEADLEFANSWGK